MELNDSIDLLNLRTREYEVFKALGVSTIKQLLLLDYECVRNLCWITSHTKKRIANLQKKSRGKFPEYKQLGKKDATHFILETDKDPANTKTLKCQYKLKNVKNKFSFPISLDVAGFCKEAVQKSNGILFFPLPKLFRITEEELDLLWQAFDGRQLGELNFDETIWANLEKLYIFKDDSLETLLSMTVGTLADVFETNDSFEKFLSGFVHLVEATLGHPLQHMNNYDTNSFIGDRHAIVYKIHLSVFDIPRCLTRPLQKAGCSFLTDVVKMSESDIIGHMGFKHSSLLLIKNLWKIRPWVLCATDMIVKLERKQSAFKTLEDMLITSLISSTHRRSNVFRDAKMAVAYMMKSLHTLDNVGQKYNLTREGVRQTINKTWKKLASPPCFKHLSLFWIVIYNSICANNGLIHLDELVHSIQDHFRWDTAPRAEQIKELIKLNSALICHERTRLICLTEWDCRSCEKMRRKLMELLNRSTSGTNIKPLNPTLERLCESCCSRSISRFEPNLALLARLLLGNSYDQVRIEGDDIYLRKHWEIKYGDSFSAIDQLMYLLEKTMT